MGGPTCTGPGCATGAFIGLFAPALATAYMPGAGMAAEAELGVSTQYGSKIMGQLGKRGWTAGSVEETISNPARTAVGRDTRWMADGTRMDDPATTYYNKDGSYVVRNNKSGDVVQVSNRNDPNWKSP
jgi:filamentous hemagglutinin